MKNEIVITRAIPEDAAGIQNVFYKTWMATYPNDEHKITVEDLEYRHKDRLTPEHIEERKKVIAEMPENELFLVAKDSETVVGVAYFVKKERNVLQAMYVLLEYQGQGIGSRFWKEGKDFLGVEKDIYVQVVTYNTPAIKFYESLGFVDTGKRFEEERFRMRNGAIFPEVEMVLKH